MVRLVRFASMYVRPFVRKEEGQDLVEYALLVALIVLGAVGFISNAGTSVMNIFDSIAGELAEAEGGAGGGE
jgi:Flp pilus assembly pilin Flp